MFPNKAQYKKWSLPSKYSLWSVIIGVVGIFVSLLSFCSDSGMREDLNMLRSLENRHTFLQRVIGDLLPGIELVEPSSAPYLDVDPHYEYSKYVLFSKEMGIINPPTREDAHFHPYKEISRAEAAKVLANVLCIATEVDDCYSGLEYSALLNYTDIENFSEFYPYIAFLVENNVFSGSGIFRPESPLSTSNAQQWLSKARRELELDKNGSITSSINYMGASNLDAYSMIKIK